MENNGWVKLYRKSLASSVWDKPNVWRTWCWCLMKANHKETKFPFNGKDIIIKKGQFITGIDKACKEIKLTRQKYRTSLDYLKNSSRITTQTTNQFTIISVIKWDLYQTINTPDNKQITNEQQTDNKRITTYKNIKNDNNEKNVKNSIAKQSFAGKDINSLIDLFKPINPSYEKFFSNKTQRSCLERMATKHGLEKMIRIINTLEKTNGVKYAPVITTPLQLENKLGDLIVFIKKEGESFNKNKIIKIC